MYAIWFIIRTYTDAQEYDGKRKFADPNRGVMSWCHCKALGMVLTLLCLNVPLHMMHML